VAIFALTFALGPDVFRLGESHVHDATIVCGHWIEVDRAAARADFLGHPLGKRFQPIDLLLAVPAGVDHDWLAALMAHATEHLANEMLQSIHHLAASADDALDIVFIGATNVERDALIDFFGGHFGTNLHALENRGEELASNLGVIDLFCCIGHGVLRPAEIG
jgi:hypothetical protein